MRDLIDRQAAIDAIEEVDWYHIGKTGELIHGANSQEHEPIYKAKDIYAVLEKLPSAQPTIEERKTGRWEEIEVIAEAYDIAGVKTWASKMQCDQCGFSTFAIEGCFSQYHFCPNCGARMEVEHD